MKLRGSFLSIVLTGTVLMLACSQEPPAQQTGAEPLDLQAPAPSENQMVSGELLIVDLDTNTFALLTDDKTEHVFRFTEATDVSGGSGMQGLATREGSRLTVHFREEADDTNTALKIEMVP